MRGWMGFRGEGGFEEYVLPGTPTYPHHRCYQMSSWNSFSPTSAVSRFALHPSDAHSATYKGYVYGRQDCEHFPLRGRRYAISTGRARDIPPTIVCISPLLPFTLLFVAQGTRIHLAEFLVIKVDFEVTHLPYSRCDENTNLRKGPPHCASVCHFGRVAELSLDFTQVSLFTLNIAYFLVQLA